MVSSLVDIVTNPQILIAMLIGIAVFVGIISIVPMFLNKAEQESRMERMVLGRNENRARTRTKSLAAKNVATLRQDDTGLMVQLVNQFNLRKLLADQATFMNLKRAGYRKQLHIYIFLFFRAVVPLILLIVASIYVFGISGMERTFMVKLLLVLITGYIGFYLPNVYIANVTKKRQLSIRRAWPDCLDLLLICIESGMSVEVALNRAAQEMGLRSVPLTEELVLTNAELSYLQNRSEAYKNLGERTGIDTVKAICTAFIQAEQYGTPLGQALRVLSQENREARMAEAEKKAASLPPKLTVPMIVFFLPVLFAIIIGPAAIQILNNNETSSAVSNK